MGMTTTYTGTKAEFVAFLQERLDELNKNAADTHFGVHRRNEYRAEAQGLEFAVRALEAWTPTPDAPTGSKT